MHFFSNSVNASFEDTVLVTKDILKRRGFEVLAEIDMRRTFKGHLTAEFRPYLILSACDLTLAHRAIQIAPEIGSVLFCNVVVQQRGAGSVHISSADPFTFMRVAQHVDLDQIIGEIRGRLEAVIEEIGYRLRPISAQEAAPPFVKAEAALRSGDGTRLLSGSTTGH